MFDKAGKESQHMISHLELGLDPPIWSDRESGRDNASILSLETEISSSYVVVALEHSLLLISR